MAKTFIQDMGISSVIPKGSVIYRGQTDAFDVHGDTAILARNVITPSRHTYFGIDYETIAENYGITTSLTVKEDLMLMNIHMLKVYNKLKAQMTKLDDYMALRALNQSYPLIKDRVTRDSDKDNDMTVLNFICTNTEYDGYYQPEMPTVDGGTMHSEIAVCKQKGFKINQHLGSKALPMPGGRSFQGVKDESLMRRHKREAESRRAAERKRIPSPPGSPGSPGSPKAKRRAAAASPTFPSSPMLGIGLKQLGSPRTPIGRFTLPPGSPSTPPPVFRW